jgi:hypothetical protein
MKNRKNPLFSLIMAFVFMTVSLLSGGCGGGGSSSGGGGGGGGNPSPSPSPQGTPAVSAVTSPLISGSTCTITGTNFNDTRSLRDNNGSYVSFMPSGGGTGINATDYPSWSATQIACTVPQLTAGALYTVVVTLVTSSGSSSSSGTASTQNTVPVLDPTKVPQIVTVDPPNQIPGQPIIITGSNFGTTQGTGSAAGYCTVGSIPVSTGLIWNDTSVTCIIPSNASNGSNQIVVHTALGGDSNAMTINITSAKPSITKITPTTVLHGQAITITGTNFGATQDPNYVQIGAVQITAGLVWSNKTITCTVPLDYPNGTFPVIVHTAMGGDSNSIDVTVTKNRPAITSITPSAPVVGQAMTITGTNFGTAQGSGSTAGYVMMGTVKVSSGLTWSATSIIFTIPVTVPGGSLDVFVHTVNDGDSNGMTVSVTSTAPSITSLSPTTASILGTVTLTGTNFGSSQGSGYVTFGLIQQSTALSWSSTSIQCVIPTGVTPSTTVPVTVYTSNGFSNAMTMTVTSNAPAITSVTPISVSISGTITITGSHFGASQGTGSLASYVEFGQVQQSTAIYWSDASIQCAIPSSVVPSSAVPIIVYTNAGGTSNAISIEIYSP